MGTVWEYQWEYTDLDDGQVKVLPVWLTNVEAGHSQTLIENPSRRLFRTRRERHGEAEWRELVKSKPSGVKPLPEFDSPAHSELVALYRRERDPDVRKTILEVVRVRRVMKEIERLTATIRAEYGDRLVALHMLRTLLRNEQRRAGEIGGLEGEPQGDDQARAGE
ncbi:hypothetical protein [Burkholderia ubonensis]|uniref:hypothetical protein n=1 Tax=Burkholderia ubonensis TaxID=101571 RepID=UPI00075EAB1D|nr:hypothetical protein [Burkholderia ubonensis]KVW77428.1 hypothetical protein WK99_27935 [Burkholderia ubonensis]